jgi:hypothetical protein
LSGTLNRVNSLPYPGSIGQCCPQIELITSGFDFETVGISPAVVEKL